MRRGWFGENYRHYLASKGVHTKAEWRGKYPDLVKDFPGDNPHLTEDSARFRQQSPSSFHPRSFRTKRVAPGKSIVLGKEKESGKYKLQSVIIKKKYFAENLRVASVNPGLPPGVQAGMEFQGRDPVWEVVDMTPNPELEVVDLVEEDGKEISKFSDFMPWNKGGDENEGA